MTSYVLLRRVLNFVRRNIYGCTPDAKELAYTSLVRPLLEYATPAWDPYRAKDIIILFAREQYSKQVQMTVEMSRTIRRKDTHLQMPFNIDS